MTEGTPLDYLRSIREAVLWKAGELDESRLRRPMTGTGTNLLGLVKHLAACEYGYFQMCFGRPVPDLPFLAPEADPTDDLWATEDESAEELLQLYRDACAASDQTVTELGLDAVGRVPWWNGREISITRAITHMTVETARHLGHMDILREQLDGRTGLGASNSNMPDRDAVQWSEHVARLQELSDRAATGTLRR